MKGIFSN